MKLRRPLTALISVAGLVATTSASGPSGVSADAAANTRHLVAMTSERTDFIGQGQARLFHDGNSTVSIGGTAKHFAVIINGGHQRRGFEAEFAAPFGTELRAGWYPGVVRLTPFDPDHPSMEITGDGRGCNTLRGNFDIKQLRLRADGAVAGVWLTYEQHCGGKPDALFGEIRIGIDSQAISAATPRVTRWPAIEAKRYGRPVPVALLAPATSSERVTSIELGGWDADDFEIRDDRCTGVVVRAREDCRVWVRFSPQSGGPKFGQLIFNLASGERRVADLEGQAVAQTTEVHLESDPGDDIGQGQTYDYDQPLAYFSGGGFPDFAFINVSSHDGADNWAGSFLPAGGDVLAAGRTYLNARRAGDSNEFPGLDWNGNRRRCDDLTGSFTVDDIGFTAGDAISYYLIRFEQHCEGQEPALRGTVSWRVPPDDRVPPGAVASLQVLRTGRQVDLTWTNPSDDDVARIIVRRLAGTIAPALPTTGVPVSVGLGSATTVQGPNAMTFAVWAVDEAGNVGPRRTISVPAD